MNGNTLGVMMKQQLVLFSAFIILIAIVSAAPQQVLDVRESVVNIKLSQSQTKTASFRVFNGGTTPLSISYDTSALDLIDRDGDRISLAFSDPSPISPNTEANVTITAHADRRVDLENYGGRVTVRDRNSPANDTFVLNIDVSPEVCNYGEVPDDITLQVEKPDNNDKVQPGDMLSIRANVKNNGRNDRRIKVEAFLFAEGGRRITEASSEARNVGDGDDEEFRFEMSIPLDSDVIGDADNKFTLFIKAFDDDNERLACIQKAVPIDIKLQKKKVIIDKESAQFFPSAVSCGDTAIASIRVLNIGDKDNTVTLQIQNSELKISKKVQNINLESFNSKERNTATVQSEIEIPKDAKKKDYVFNVRADYEGGFAATELKLAVLSCKGKTVIVEGGPSALLIPTQNFVAKPNSLVVIPVEVTNTFKKKASFTVALKNVNDFALGSSKTMVLSPGQKSTVFMELVLKDISPADYSGVIELSSEEGTIASDTIIISINQEEMPQAQGLTDTLKKLPWGFWVVLNVVIIGLIVLAIKIITALR